MDFRKVQERFYVDGEVHIYDYDLGRWLKKSEIEDLNVIKKTGNPLKNSRKNPILNNKVDTPRGGNEY